MGEAYEMWKILPYISYRFPNLNLCTLIISKGHVILFPLKVAMLHIHDQKPIFKVTI